MEWCDFSFFLFVMYSFERYLMVFWVFVWCVMGLCWVLSHVELVCRFTELQLWSPCGPACCRVWGRIQINYAGERKQFCSQGPGNSFLLSRLSSNHSRLLAASWWPITELCGVCLRRSEAEQPKCVCVFGDTETPQLCTFSLWCVFSVSWGDSPLFISGAEEAQWSVQLSFSGAGRKRLGAPAGRAPFTNIIVCTWERSYKK